MASGTHLETENPLAQRNICLLDQSANRRESNHIDPNVVPKSIHSQAFLPYIPVGTLLAPCKSCLDESNVPSPPYSLRRGKRDLLDENSKGGKEMEKK